MDQIIRCPHCNRKLAEYSFNGTLALGIKCPKCRQIVQVNLMSVKTNVTEKSVTEIKNENPPVVKATVLYPHEVADLMKISRWTVYELVKRKKLPATKIG